MMKWMLLPVALTISAIAAYYSIYGLATIFAAAVIPIIVMGAALEVGKLVSEKEQVGQMSKSVGKQVRKRVSH